MSSVGLLSLLTVNYLSLRDQSKILHTRVSRIVETQTFSLLEWRPINWVKRAAYRTILSNLDLGWNMYFSYIWRGKIITSCSASAINESQQKAQIAPGCNIPKVCTCTCSFETRTLRHSSEINSWVMIRKRQTYAFSSPPINIPSMHAYCASLWWHIRSEWKGK